jgi:hypothetical protein
MLAVLLSINWSSEIRTRLLNENVRKMKFAAVVIAGIGLANAQSQATAPPKQATTALTMEFEAASVRPDKPDARPVTNFPSGPENTPSGGLFSGSGNTLYQYIALAYDFTIYDYQLLKSRLPEWVLTDRFKLSIHLETREVPEFALVLAKPGNTGPQLRPHSDQPPRSAEAPCGRFDS